MVLFVLTLMYMLHVYVLIGNPLGDDGAIAIAHLICRALPSLHTLDLRSCNISGDGMAAIFTACEKNGVITNINLSAENAKTGQMYIGNNIISCVVMSYRIGLLMSHVRHDTLNWT